ncbi:hypothetical protein NKH77_49645 [Streptomyces sp. M19]
MPTELGCTCWAGPGAARRVRRSADHGQGAGPAGAARAGPRAGRRGQPWVPVLAAMVRDRLPHHEQLTFLEPSSQTVLELLRTEKIALAVVSEFPDVAPPALRGLEVRDLGTEPVLVGLAPGTGWPTGS